MQETQVVAYRLPDGVLYQLRDLPWEPVAKIEKAHGVPWVLLIDAPHTNGSALVDIARLVHAVNGHPDPVVETVADAAELIGRLVLVDATTGEPVTSPEADEVGPVDVDGWEPTKV